MFFGTWTQLGSFYFVEFILRVALGISIPAMASSMSSCLLRAFKRSTWTQPRPTSAQRVTPSRHGTYGKHMENQWKTMRFEMFVYDFARPGQALQDRQPFFRSPRVLPRNEYELMP